MWRNGMNLDGTYLVEFPNLSDEVAECLGDVDAMLCGRLDEHAAERFCKVTTFCGVSPSKVWVVIWCRALTLNADLPLIL